LLSTCIRLEAAVYPRLSLRRSKQFLIGVALVRLIFVHKSISQTFSVRMHY
jgi:hypothetical protein